MERNINDTVASPKLRTYCTFKDSFTVEPYLLHKTPCGNGLLTLNIESYMNHLVNLNWQNVHHLTTLSG